MPQPEELFAIRTWIAENHAPFRKAAQAPRKVIGEMRGSTLQRVPKGFDCGHPAEDLLKMKQWFYGCRARREAATSSKLFRSW